MSSTLKRPSVANTVNTISRIQLHRYNVATKKLTHRVLQEWAEELSTEDKPVDYYFIDINFSQLQDPAVVEYLNKVPTSFDLTNKQVTSLIEAGKSLVVQHPEFKRLLRDISFEK
jgi:NTE family protein